MKERKYIKMSFSEKCKKEESNKVILLLQQQNTGTHLLIFWQWTN